MSRSLALLPAACAAALFALLPACRPEDLPGAETFAGPRVAVGAGEAWTEVTLAADGAPLAVAAAFTRDALRDLPPPPSDHGGHVPANEFVLALPEEAPVASYDHVTLDWNAAGHAPPGVYDVPHFDVHFYFIDAAERDLIGPFDSVAFNRPLPADLLPPHYIETPGGVPRMGAHVVDGLSPEIAGTGPFTHTLIYGKYDGALNFLEPMVAMSMLEEERDASARVRRPTRYGLEGYFPGVYSVRYDEADDTYRVVLFDLERRT